MSQLNMTSALLLVKLEVARLLLRRLHLLRDHAALVENFLQLARVHLEQQLRLHVLVRLTAVTRENLGREVEVNHVLLSVQHIVHLYSVMRAVCDEAGVSSSARLHTVVNML
jgi:hypothetical protein